MPASTEERPGPRLAGRSAVITGAARGIGRATAVEFARQGARLVLADVDGDALAAAAAALDCAEIETVVGDVRREADVRAIIDAAGRRHDGPDVVVANAGIIALSSLLETSVEDWDTMMAVDGRGMFLTCKYAIERMVRHGRGGAIVCVSSISGLAGQAGQAAYGPAKFVATGLVHHLAVEWAPAGIRVNGVAPGTIRTDRVEELLADADGERYVREMEGQHPLGRLGEPHEVARAMAFLASDDASFITGAVLPVDGGYLAR